MSKMTRGAQDARSASKKEALSPVTNFMGMTSYRPNPMETLKIVTSSSIFGEPQYYRKGEFAEKGATGRNVSDGTYRINTLSAKYELVIGAKWAGKNTSEVMEGVIDEALDFDFGGTLNWAVTLRNDFMMRLNPQVIMVRAARHPKRKEFTDKNPGRFATAGLQIMRRMDEPAAQLAYWLYRFHKKNNMPSVLKRAWAARLEKGRRYEMAKYKNAGLGLIDVIRISHAKGALVGELVTTGTIEVTEDQMTWEMLRSQGKTWADILTTIEIPHMALLRNLRGIFSEISDSALAKVVCDKLKAGVAGGKQFPFRYKTAYDVIKADSKINHRPILLNALEECIDLACANMPKFKKVASLSDNSGSAWGAVTSEYGSTAIAEIDNLSSTITAKCAEEGYVGIFGDKLEMVPVTQREGVLAKQADLTRVGRNIGGGTEHGVWLFWERAINQKEHWDEVFIYSDQQAGHGGLYGHGSSYKEFTVNGDYDTTFDVLKMIQRYRETVNPKVNVFCIQTAGYDNVLVPEQLYRTSILYGWTGREAVYAAAIDKLWDEFDAARAEKKAQTQGQGQ